MVPVPALRLLRAAALEPLRHVAEEQRQHAGHQQGPALQGLLSARGVPVFYGAGLSGRFHRRPEHRGGDDDLLPDSADGHGVLPAGAPDDRAGDVHGRPGDVPRACQSVLPGRERTSSTCLIAVGMFATPVVYPTRHVGGVARGRCSSSIRSRRSSTAIAPSCCVGELPHPVGFTAAAVFALCLLAVGWVVFHRAEYAFAENA